MFFFIQKTARKGTYSNMSKSDTAIIRRCIKLMLYLVRRR